MALSIAAFVMLRSGDVAVEDENAHVKDVVAVLEPSEEMPAEIPKIISLSPEADIALLETDSPVVGEVQADAIAQEIAPEVIPENAVVSDTPTTATEVPIEPAVVAEPDTDTDTDTPETAIVAVESPKPDVVLSLDAVEPQPAQTPEKTEEVIAPLDPNLPALELGAPLQAGTQTTEISAANAPVPEGQPQNKAASQPLSLAHVLPPGEAPAPDQISPSFDLVRVSPDGSAVIAGRAAPGATVQVFSGTIPVAEATASARGEFVVFLDAPDNTTLDLNIPAAPEGASLVISQEDIVILPAAPDSADATPIVVRRTPDAVQIVQPSTPAIPGIISLDLVSYTDSGAVQLAGRGQPGNIARIYANDALAGESHIAEGGAWALEISDIAEGRYVLRIDEISPSGDVLSRTESPFQRQFPEASLPNGFSQGAKIIVQPGNTLWLMATEAYGSGDAYSQIFTENKAAIRDPDLIYPGQIFSIPRAAE